MKPLAFPPGPRWFVFVRASIWGGATCVSVSVREGTSEDDPAGVSPEAFVEACPDTRQVVYALSEPLTEEDASRVVRAMFEGGPAFSEAYRGTLVKVYVGVPRTVRENM